VTGVLLQLRAVALGATYRLRLRFRPVATINKAAPPVARRTRPVDVDALSTAVGRVGRIIPGQTCLPNAYTMRDLMHRHGHRAEVVLGVGAPGPNGLAAHAWVEDAQGRVVHGASDEPFQRFE
jgi:hypothetical protein